MVHLLLAVIYLAFISLGLPDSLLGSAWPSMQRGIWRTRVLCGHHLHDHRRWAPWYPACRATASPADWARAVVTAFSVLMTALALLGFSLSRSFCGPVPAGHPLRPRRGQRGRGAQQLRGPSLRQPPHELAALHVGRGRLRQGRTSWNTPSPAARAGTRATATSPCLQFALTLILLLSLPLWKERAAADAGGGRRRGAPLALSRNAPRISPGPRP